jgi:hypothetical protein
MSFHTLEVRTLDDLGRPHVAVFYSDDLSSDHTIPGDVPARLPRARLSPGHR